VEAARGEEAGCTPDALTAWSPHGGHVRGGTASLCAPVDKVSQKRRCEHREGGGDAPDEVVAVRAHPSSGSKCGGGVEAARRCPTLVEALQSRAAPVVGSCSTGGGGEGEAHATCEPRHTEDPAHRGLGGGAEGQCRR
jgi:hypothetical protein